MRVMVWLAIAVGVHTCRDKNEDACTITKDGSEDCRYLNNCDSDGCCVHKDLMPLKALEAGGTVLVFILSGMANAGGIGGGPIMTAFEILLFYFNPKQAIPLSQVIIVAGGIVSLSIRAFLRHPTKDRPLLEYNLSMLIIPPILLGSTFGVMVNKVLPNVAILAILTIVLIIITWMTARNGIRMFITETKQKKAAAEKAEELRMAREEGAENANLLGELDRYEDEETENKEDPFTADLLLLHQTPDRRELSLSSKQETQQPLLRPDEPSKDKNPELAVILKREGRQFPLIPCVWIVFVFCYVALGLSIRGGSGTSFAGIKFCSTGFMIFLVFWSFGLLMLTILPIFYLLRLKKTYERVGYEYDEFDMKWTLWKALQVWLAGFFGGFGGGMLGFGASLLVAPILVQWKMRSPVIGPTAALMTVIGSAISVMQFAEQKSLIYEYAGWLAMVAFLGSIIGVISVTKLMIKLDRNSILVLMLAAVLAIAMFLVPIYTLVDVIKKERDGGGNYSLKSYC